MADMKIVILALATAGVLISGTAQAALNDRGGGLLYDDVLNVTWLQDANYAKTSGYDADGLMKWDQAKTWAGGLSISRFAGESLTGWRLASNTPVNGTWNYDWSKAGTTDYGYNVTSPHSELSYMYYVNLGLKGVWSPTSTYQADFGVFGDGTQGGQKDVSLVKNLQSHTYWSGTVFALSPASSAWTFAFTSGFQGYGIHTQPDRRFGIHDAQLYAWAVRSGDVAAVMVPVPEPETYAMMLAGLGMLGAVARRRKQQVSA